jgi:6-phosphofructokinase 2
LPAAVQEGVFLIKPSLRELRTLAQRDLEHERDQDNATMELISSGRCEAVVVSLGTAGVLLATSTGCTRMRSPSVPVRSKVGAGDSMVAGIALGLAHDRPVQDALRLGVAAVMNPGTELCHREDAERLFTRVS